MNSTSGEGAAIWGGSSDLLALANSIVYGNRGVSGQSEIWGYSSPSYRYSDLCTAQGGATAVAGTGNICANPLLTSSGNGTSSSPTIGKGSNALVPAGLTTDIVGHPRVTSGRKSECPRKIVDMGAFQAPGVSCRVSPPPPAPRCVVTAHSGK